MLMAVKSDQYVEREEPSTIACDLARLKAAIFKSIKARERLPQPLFWSLFFSQISELKQRKEAQRLVDELFS